MSDAGTKTIDLADVGGRLSLGLANTIEWRGSDEPEESLTSYADLVAWGQQVGVLTPEQTQRLREEAGRRTADAEAVLERAIALREAIYGIFAAIANGSSPPQDDLDTLNAELSRALARSQVVPTGAGFSWGWSPDGQALDRVLWPVARDAANLLTDELLDRVGECDGVECGWLFVDMSRNRARRWCSMEECGNRAKARRHYRRQCALEEAEAC